MPKNLSQPCQSTRGGSMSRASVDPNNMARYVIKVDLPDPHLTGPYTTLVEGRPQQNKVVYRCTFPGCSKPRHLFGNRSDATRHARAHDENTKHQCPYCPHATPQQSNLDHHVATKHVNPKLDGRTREGRGRALGLKKRVAEVQHGAPATPFLVPSFLPAPVPAPGPWLGMSGRTPTYASSTSTEMTDSWTQATLEDPLLLARSEPVSFHMDNIQMNAGYMLQSGMSSSASNSYTSDANPDFFLFSQHRVPHTTQPWIDPAPFMSPSQSSGRDFFPNAQHFAPIPENQLHNDLAIGDGVTLDYFPGHGEYAYLSNNLNSNNPLSY